MLLGNCNIWGNGALYGERIYTEPCYIFDAYDFGVALYDYLSGNPIEDISWQLFRRNPNLDPDGIVDETHILVDSGTAQGVLYISLHDYGLRYQSDDYFIKTWKTNDHNHIGYLRIKYLANDYTSNDSNWPYIREVVQAQKKVVESVGGGGGMGGSVVTHTEYKEKPLPIIKVMAMDEDDDDIKNKEIVIINIKDLDNI